MVRVKNFKNYYSIAYSRLPKARLEAARRPTMAKMLSNPGADSLLVSFSSDSLVSVSFASSATSSEDSTSVSLVSS
ncbi:MAG: hypothetical protein QG666_1420, partial [Euryarchaeota archaeon]|nr:hypothetical protein [Euryarchaeota archaeon]